ncbi:hypothetical protein CEUSTIGMA_g9722.t1 [Chlamydomonas eustigma]|uniref:Kinesin-like protein n=1 Tax=Chlamydomonas eustigma TaxID=1157962 RepID=A0A250XGW8_9CHLO|nr:hypothetical protein CEUSTIGMA_g9722.t1 [Chlamydomonas eustigma]|eukprot:GAX82293.1 hypothetical protein CEUSTIGMA_g9722.t1 [Chlamydomonas eustigma]
MDSFSRNRHSDIVLTSVRCRLRPLHCREPSIKCVKTHLPLSLVVFNGPEGLENTFKFDSVYDEDVSQQAVFNDVSYIVDAVIEGFNGTIITYGQTGSGKTHTLFGQIDHADLQGVVPRALSHLFRGLSTTLSGQPSKCSGPDFSIHMSVVEIYSEKIRDLLDPSRDNLSVKQDPTRGIYIDGASEVSVHDELDERQLVVFMQEGLRQRSVSATCMNSESSRSHCIVTVVVERACPDGSVKCGRLCMVDLAGSERQSKTGAAATTLAEGCQINKSLSCLANVIQALTDDKGRSHVPYRDSKLTRVLQDSLGGSARTVLIVCCSPSMSNAAETLSTLRFGSRAQGLSNKVVMNQRISTDVLSKQLEERTSRVQELEGKITAVTKELETAHAAMQATQIEVQMLLQSTKDLNSKLKAAENECKVLRDTFQVQVLVQELDVQKQLIEDMKLKHAMELVQQAADGHHNHQLSLLRQVHELQQELKSSKVLVAELQERLLTAQDTNISRFSEDIAIRDYSMLERELRMAQGRVKELEDDYSLTSTKKAHSSPHAESALSSSPNSVLPPSDEGDEDALTSNKAVVAESRTDHDGQALLDDSKTCRQNRRYSILYRMTVDLASVLAVILGVTVYCKNFEREVLKAYMSSDCENI